MADPRRRDRTRPDQLLRTKLMRPRLPPTLVPRPALLERLDDSLAKKLTLVSAPTGYGKSTLVAQWLAARREPSAWVALDRADEDPARFWTYVISSCQHFAPGLGKAALAALRTSRQPAFEPLIISFINDLTSLPQAGILVLEDYHAISSPVIHAGIAFLLDHLPGTLHLMVLTRAEPPLPLARLRAHNQVSELDAADLRFTEEETHAFLQQELQAPLKPETVARVDARTEGWPAGLRLVVLALEGNRDPAAIEQFLLSYSGSHRHVSEYLTAEVLAGQPEPLQAFLLQTSILDRLAPSLCNAVTGREDSGGVLSQIERTNLFLVPLGDEGGHAWYRYHAMFAEALRSAARDRFGEAVIWELYSRASGWYEAYGMTDQGVESALAAREYRRAARLIERALDWRSRRELHTLRRWIEQLPPGVLDENPALCFEYAVALLFTSDRYSPATAARLEQPLAAAERVWRREGDGPRLGQALALRAMVRLWQGDFEAAYALAHESLAMLPERELFWRSSDLIIAGIEELNAGRLETAQDVLIEARALAGACQSQQGQLAATGLLADAYGQQGEFDQARQLYEQVRSEATGSDDMLDDQGSAALGLAAIAYERNDLDAAERDARHALELGRQRGNDHLAVRAASMLARVLQARGQGSQAQERLAAQLAQTSHPLFVRELLTWKARLALASGDMEAVRRWSAGVVPRPAGPLPLALQEQQDLVTARLLLADGDFPAALALLEPWLEDARQNGRTSSELQASLLLALAHAARSEQAEIGRALASALAIAQSGGYVRTILDEGEPVRQLLSERRASIEEAAPRLKAYIYKLLGAFTPDAGRTPPQSEAVDAALPRPFEPLSLQEKRVLRLLAAGLSNPEIANELVVSTNTIKTQVQSIYRKLDVNSRAEASEVARALNLV